MADFTEDQISALKELNTRRASLSADQASALDELNRRAGIGGRPAAKNAAIPEQTQAAEHNFGGVKYQYDPNEPLATNPVEYGKQIAKTGAEIGLGVGKGAIGTLYHIGRFVGAVPKNQDFEAALEGENAAQTTGKVAENVAEFIGGEGAVNVGLKAVGLAGKLANAGTAARIAAKVAKGAAVGGGVTALQGGDAKTGAILGAAGGGVQGLVEDALPAVLKAGADKSYARFLGAAGKADKIRTQDVIDEALKRGVKGSLGEVAATADASKAGAVQNLDDLYAAHAGERVPASDIAGALDDAKKEYAGINATNGKANIYGPEAKKAVKIISGLRKAIDGATDNAGTIDVGELRTIRKAWYEIVDGTTNNGYAGGAQTLTQKIHKQAAAAIADVLNTELPDVAAINKEYTFWKKLGTVANNTLLRRSSQEVPMSERIVQGAITGAGMVTGGPAGAIVKGEAARLLMKAARSGAWRSASAVWRNDLANAIAAGKGLRVTSMLNNLVKAAASEATRDEAAQ